MADHSISISNGFGLFGLAPTNNWNEFNWGESNWGEGDFDMYVRINKFISNSISPTSTIYKSTFKFITDTLTVTSDPSEEYLRTGNGYYYVFRRPTTNGENRVITSWSEV